MGSGSSSNNGQILQNDSFDNLNDSQASKNDQDFFNKDDDSEDYQSPVKKNRVKRGYSQALQCGKDDNTINSEQMNDKKNNGNKPNTLNLSQLPSHLLMNHQKWFIISPSYSYMSNLKNQQSLEKKTKKSEKSSHMDEDSDEEEDKSYCQSPFQKQQKEAEKIPCRLGIALKNIFYIGTSYEPQYKYDVFDEKLLERKIYDMVFMNDYLKKNIDENNFSFQDEFQFENADNELERAIAYKEFPRQEKFIKSQQKDFNEIGIMPFCIKGTQTYNELFKTDYFTYIEKNISIYIVSEGNGPFSIESSYSAIRLMAKYLLEAPNIEKQPADVLKQAFLEVSQKLNNIHHDNGKSFDCALSGASLCVILHISNHLYTANVGSCGAVILRSIPEKDPLFYTLVTAHTASNTEELKRIFSCGGEVRLDIKNIPRVYCKGRVYPGIKNTKGIGNKVANVIGVSDDPDIKIYKLNDKSIDVAIIIGNTELLNLLAHEELINILLYCNTSNLCSAYEYIQNKIKNNYIQKEFEVDDLVGLLIFN